MREARVVTFSPLIVTPLYSNLSIKRTKYLHTILSNKVSSKLPVFWKSKKSGLLQSENRGGALRRNVGNCLLVDTALNISVKCLCTEMYLDSTVIAPRSTRYCVYSFMPGVTTPLLVK